MRCRWLAHFLAGEFHLPRIRDMEEDASRWQSYYRKYLGNSYNTSCVGAIHIWYCDQLCRDMGCNPRRKTGLFADWFTPYLAMDYAQL